MQINLDETKKALRGLEHYRPMITDVSQLNLIAVLQMNQSAGVARVDFRNPRSGVGHSGALIMNTIVQLNFVAINVMIVRVVNL
jgi:hypothetical protein